MQEGASFFLFEEHIQVFSVVENFFMVSIKEYSN